MTQGFVVWIQGRPASGKTTVARRVRDALRRRRVPVLWLDSDDLRPVLTPKPDYSEAERERFYGALVHLARRGAEGGVGVLISATGMRRAWRDELRAGVDRFSEVELSCPLEVAEGRDPKGLYAAARAGRIQGLPGLDAPLERSERAELVLDAARMDPSALTDAILRWMEGHDVLDDA